MKDTQRQQNHLVEDSISKPLKIVRRQWAKVLSARILPQASDKLHNLFPALIFAW